MTDMVNHPAHYTGSIECIDAIEAATSELSGIEAVCVANVLKYVWRFKRKNGLQDLEKARWYLNRLIQAQSPESSLELSSPGPRDRISGDK